VISICLGNHSHERSKRHGLFDLWSHRRHMTAGFVGSSTSSSSSLWGGGSPSPLGSLLEYGGQPLSQQRWMIRGTFLLLGIGVLIPWNTFISAKPYFESRLCSFSISPNNDTIQQQQQQLRYAYACGGLPNIESTFSTVYSVSSVLTMVLIIGVQMLRSSTGCTTTWTL
jgi:hypothetical protein